MTISEAELLRASIRPEAVSYRFVATSSPSMFDLPKVSEMRSLWTEWEAHIGSTVLPTTLVRIPRAGRLAGSDLVVGLTFMEETAQWMAVDNLVGEYGEGGTCSEAVQDLIVSLFGDRDLLARRAHELHPALHHDLDTLNARLRDEML